MTDVSDEELRVLSEEGVAEAVLAAVLRERDRCAKIVCGYCAIGTPMIANAEMLKTWGDCHQIPGGGTATCMARLITGRVGTANAEHFAAR